VIHWASRGDDSAAAPGPAPGEGHVGATSMRVVMTGLVALLLAGCGGGGGGAAPTVPEGSGTVEIQSESLVAVSRESCHVQGVVVNVSTDSTFDVTLRWEARDAADRSRGTTRADVLRLAPGEARAYDATGFASNSQGLVPCSAIARFVRLQTLITPR
jgi:hypothetical protein